MARYANPIPSAVAGGDFDLFFRRAGMVIEPFTFEQARIARQAGNFSRTDVEPAVTGQGEE